MSEPYRDRTRQGFDTREQAYAHIAGHPAKGAIDCAHEFNLPARRFWPLKRYSYVGFYVAQETHIEVWRALNAKRDIPAWLQENTTP